MIVNTLVRNYSALVNTLAEYVQQRRAELGLTQQELAGRSDLSRDFVAQVESGKSKLPVPDNRRKLAKGLGVTHLELLIAAGEITEEELGDKTGIVEQVPDDPKERIIAQIQMMRLKDDELTALASFTQWMASQQSQTPAYDTRQPHPTKHR